MKHVGQAAQRAAREVPELAQKLALAREPIPYLAFRSLARTVAAEAEARKEVLVRHGLVDQVLVSLNDGMAQFDQAMQRSGGRPPDPHRGGSRARCGTPVRPSGL